VCEWLGRVADAAVAAVELFGERPDVVGQSDKALVEPPRLMVVAQASQAASRPEAGAQEGTLNARQSVDPAGVIATDQTVREQTPVDRLLGRTEVLAFGGGQRSGWISRRRIRALVPSTRTWLGLSLQDNDRPGEKDNGAE
jgi:hypothetical protein